MARPANQASGAGSTNKAKVKKPAAKNRPAGTPTTPGLYGWDGGPKTHSIDQATHDMHVADPLTKDPLYASAKQQATAYYAPQTNALTTLQTNAPVWYQNYMNQAKASGVASAAYAQPVIGQAQQFATNVNAPAAGLDPNSPEYAKSVQAGQGLSALATLGAQNLQANQAADQTYFAGQATNAAGALPGVLAGYATQQGQLGSQVAGKTQEIYQGNKQTAVNEDIARQTLLGNQANMAADNTLAAQTAAQTAKDRRAARVVSRRNTTDRIAAQGTAQQTAADKAAAKQAEKDAAAKTKKTATIQAAVGKIKNKIKDIQDQWAQGGVVEYTVQQTVDKKTGKPVGKDFTGPTKIVNVKKTRPVKRDELRGQLVQQHGEQMVSIMERVRKGQPITQQQIDYLHNQDPDFRVPAEWKNGKARAPVRRPGNAPGTGGQNRPT